MRGRGVRVGVRVGLGVAGIFLAVWTGGCLGYTITTCGGNQKVQIEESGDAVFTCAGITREVMLWALNDTNGTESSVASCPSSGQCTVYENDYSVSRPQRNTSVLNVTGNYRRRIAGTVRCVGLVDEGKPVKSAPCNARVVYTSYSVNCTPSVNKTDWTVNAACDVDKIYASDGNYNCQWRTSSSGSLASFPGQITTTPFEDSKGQQYHRMTCSFTGQPLPTEDDNHTYLLTIDPGKNPTQAHSVILHIEFPKGPPVLPNCPSTVVEGDDVSCTCQASASKPSALVSWTDKSAEAVNSASTLQLNNVNKSLDGQRFTCRQYWGGFDTGHVKETNYTFNVTPPTEPQPQELLLIVGAAVGATVLIIIIIIIIIVVVVVVIRRRRGRAKDDDVIEEHVNEMYQSADDPDPAGPKPPSVTRRAAGAQNRAASPAARASPNGEYTMIPSDYFKDRPTPSGQSPGEEEGADRGSNPQPQTTGRPQPPTTARPPGPVSPPLAGDNGDGTPKQGRPLATNYFALEQSPKKQTTNPAGNDYNTLDFFRRPSLELSDMPEAYYSHAGAV